MMAFDPDSKSHIPLYKQLEFHFIAQIRKGVFPPGSALPSISQLEKQLPSLGRVTIVRALQELADEGFVMAIHGKGFYVTQMGDTALLGLVAPLHSGYMEIYVNLLAGLSSEAARCGHRVLPMSSDESPKRFIDAVDELVKTRGSKWLVLVPPASKGGKIDKECCDKIKELAGSGRTRLVAVDRDGSLPCPRIVQDREGALDFILGRAARLSCKRVAFLSCGLSTFPDLEARARQFGEMTVFSAPSQGAEKDFQSAVKDSCDLLVCGNDDLARGILDRAGGNPPFKLCGLNGTAYATGMTPRITTVNMGLGEAGRLAFRILSDGAAAASDETIKMRPFFVEGETF